MDNKGYFVVHEWMVKELGLKGTELLVYAIIFGFTQIEEQRFFGTRRYLSEFTGASIPTIQRTLDCLVEKGLLTRYVDDTPANGVRIVSYKANLNPQCQNDTGIKMTHIDNIHKPISNKGVTGSKGSTFSKPTVEEIEAYCKEKGYKIDAQYFWDYNESKGWVVGRVPMKDWKAAIRTWVRNEKHRQSAQAAPQIKRPSNEPKFFDD